MISDDETIWDAVFDREFTRLDHLIRDDPALPDHLGDYFHHAAAQGDIELATFFLDRGVDINSRNEEGETAFSYSCAYDQREMARFLVDRGADINTADAGGGSPLDWAVCHASQEFREWLTAIGGKRNDDSYEPWPPPKTNNATCEGAHPE